VLLDKVNIDVIAKDTANGKVCEEFANNKYSSAQKGVPLSEYVIRCDLLAAGA
jgi:glucose dehydrogenase